MERSGETVLLMWGYLNEQYFKRWIGGDGPVA